MKERITGVILAGGEGRRMGGVDKGLQNLDGRPLVQWVLERLAPQVAAVVINANQNLARYGEFGCAVLPDRIPDHAGPLAGLHAALLSATTPLVATVPCDSPFLPADLVKRLLEALDAQNAELAVARSGDQVHRTFCLARRELLPKLDAFLARGERKVGCWYASLKVAEVSFDDKAEAFTNINTAEELSAHQATDRNRRFGGIERLYGAGALRRAAAAHITVVGIGGVGSWAAEALARSGIGRLTLIDLDHVAESNINRQIHALESTFGAAKVEAMKQRIAEINPVCVVDGVEEFIDEANVATLIPPCDAVIDAIDQVRAKAALIAHCRRAGICIVTTGGAGGRTDPTQIEVMDLSRTTQDALTSKVRARLRKDYGFTRDLKKKFGVECVFSPEQIRRPANADSCSVDHGFDATAGLACAGYGSSVMVTANFGFIAAARVLAGILTA